MLRQIYFALALIAFIYVEAAPKFDTPKFLESLKGLNDLAANIDGLIDENIDSIRNSLKDPADLKDKKFALTRHIYLRLDNGFTKKVSQLHRSGPCTLFYENRTLEFEGNFGWDDLDFKYDYLLQVLFLKKQGLFLGNLKEVDINIVLDVDFKAHRFILKRFSFVNAGKISLRVEGQRLGDKIMNLVLKFWTWVGKWSVLGQIQSNAVDSIKAGIDELNEILGRKNQQKFTFVNEAVKIVDVDDVDLYMI